jgi:hypothetical protein
MKKLSLALVITTVMTLSLNASVAQTVVDNKWLKEMEAVVDSLSKPCTQSLALATPCVVNAAPADTIAAALPNQTQLIYLQPTQSKCCESRSRTNGAVYAMAGAALGIAGALLIDRYAGSNDIIINVTNYLNGGDLTNTNTNDDDINVTSDNDNRSQGGRGGTGGNSGGGGCGMGGGNGGD